MGKYNFEINEINPNTVHGMILSQIKPGSSVLECGCATGYMTKYMHEKLNCTVDVIDYDCESLSKAKRYARDSFFDDLDDGNWFVHYYQHNNEYDYILFADVLEHLKQPDEVLKWAVRLLKADGKILISIPNICHNDILVRMFYGYFTYTPLGLLDNTHIHFWGANDIGSFINNAGLKVKKVKALLVPTQHTEQRVMGEIDEELLEVLKKRGNEGEVYQWVVTCEQK